MNVYYIVMFESNYSVRDIRNSDLGEGIICFGEGSGGKGEGKWGKRGREKGVDREVGNAYPPPPPPVHPSELPPLNRKKNISFWNFIVAVNQN